MASSAPEPQNLPYFPRAVLSVSRAEFYGQDPDHAPLPLEVRDGKTGEPCLLPSDLQGHFFLVGPAGSVASPYLPGSSTVVYATGTSGWVHAFNGDGMIYRLDFHRTPEIPFQGEPGQPCPCREETGKAWFATRLVKTPDYYADGALYPPLGNYYRETFPDEYETMVFFNAGIARLSIALGVRNSLNTALLPLPFTTGQERLLLTWDAGRPYEIDPVTLDLVAPIGWRHQWYSLVKELQFMPFYLSLATAHPQFDTHTDEMFTVNAVKSVRTLLWIPRQLSFNAKQWGERFAWIPGFKALITCLTNLAIALLSFVQRILTCLGWGGKNFVYLNRWRGTGTAVEQWEVLDAKGQPLKIYQSLHQMGLTEDYVILADSAFKLALEDLIPSGKGPNLFLESLGRVTRRMEQLGQDHPETQGLAEELLDISHKLRKYLSYPQLPYTDLYLIPRVDLTGPTRQVRARQVRIGPETAHFLVDYRNPGDKITLHAMHSPANDPAEFVHGTDESYYRKDPDAVAALKVRAGLGLDGMDVSRLGSWVIDAQSGSTQPVQQVGFLADGPTEDHLWALALYAWSGYQPDRLTDIYWNCWGMWRTQLSRFFYGMYDVYPWEGGTSGPIPEWSQRLVPVETMVDQVIDHGRPANLVHAHVDCSSAGVAIHLEGVYDFPPGYLGNSPQFIARPGSTDPTDGYLVCVVTFSDNLLGAKNEFWVFDAQDLPSGPRYRLSNPHINIGMTVHTAWLSQLQFAPVREDYSVRKDYEAAVKATGSRAIATLFDRDIYPHFDRPAPEQ